MAAMMVIHLTNDHHDSLSYLNRCSHVRKIDEQDHMDTYKWIVTIRLACVRQTPLSIKGFSW
jgi:hypothetical protein